MPHPVVCFGSAALYAGLLSATMLGWDEAASHFEAAIDGSVGAPGRAGLNVVHGELIVAHARLRGWRLTADADLLARLGPGERLEL